MSFMGMSDDDMAPFIMSIVVFIIRSSPFRVAERRRCRRTSTAALFGHMLRPAPGVEKGPVAAFTSMKRGGCRSLERRGIRPSFAVSLE
jgi:hypothetical protein